MSRSHSAGSRQKKRNQQINRLSAITREGVGGGGVCGGVSDCWAGPGLRVCEGEAWRLGLSWRGASPRIKGPFQTLGYGGRLGGVCVCMDG